MDFEKLKTAKENTELAYVVFKEHTLGYIFRLGNSFYLGVLESKILKGGLNWRNGNYTLLKHEFKFVRKATEKDFDDYKVVSKGYNLTQ